MARGSETPYQDEIRIVAEGIRRVDGRPPGPRLNLIIIRVRDEEGYREGGVDALRELLDAVLARPNSPAALPVFNLFLSRVPNLQADDPWFDEIDEASRGIADGRIVVPPELRDFVSARADRFCRLDGAACPR